MDKKNLNLKFGADKRIQSKEDFSRVFEYNKKNACKVELRDLILLYCPNHRETVRLGTIIPKKKLRSAVLRNRLRRIIKESFRCNQFLLGGRDIVVLAKRSIGKAKFDELSSSLVTGWLKISNPENKQDA